MLQKLPGKHGSVTGIWERLLDYAVQTDRESLLRISFATASGRQTNRNSGHILPTVFAPPCPRSSLGDRRR